MISPPERLSAMTADGVRLSLLRWLPRSSRRGTVLCTHAMMANARYFARAFAPYLADVGMEVFALDWRGHGASVPPSPRRDQWDFDDYVQLDLPAAVAAVCHAADIEPAQLTYLGHSLGGLVGLAAFATGTAPEPGRLSLWATSVWLPGRAGSLRRRAIMKAFSLAARPLGFAPARWLKIGSNDEPRAYVDQLAGWARRGRWLGRHGQDYTVALERLRAPVFAVCGEGDRLCRAADAAVLVDRIAVAQPLRRVGPRFGDPLAPDHFELFTDPRLCRLWDELATFAAGAAS